MVAKKSITLVHLYPKEMNIYGDNGNVLVVQKRLEQRGVDVKVLAVEIGDELPQDTDIIISGGGQDTGQVKVAEDLQRRKEILQAMAKDGVTMLVICGTYQLFGHRFLAGDGVEIPGISIFDAETIAGNKRLIGNITIKTPYGELVGYENHSGNTVLYNDQQPFGEVLAGMGNNESDSSEGAQIYNVFGTYLHGPLLPKNPQFADEIITRALQRKYGEADLTPLNDELALTAARIAKTRPR